jgi:flavorubredoxin
MNKLLIFFALINLLNFCWCDKGKPESKDIINIGINDKTLKEYEGQFPLPNGMSFNSYLIIDEKILIINGVEKKYEDEWLKNLQNSLGGREPDYILILHMELDSSESLETLVKKYPKVKIVSSKKSFILMKKYFKEDFSKNSQEVKEGDELTLGKHTLHFITAPMIHWPDVLLTYDSFTQSLFSCDVFGTFGTNDVEAPWDDEGRRFYYSVIGKYGEQVQSLLKKLSGFQIKNIFPNHGPALSENLDHYLSLYDK